jgi:hypothetical protein
MAEIRVNSTGGVKLFDADDSHYAQIKAGTISSNTDVLELGSSAVVAGTKVDLNGQELILDADADTSITADTDDQIDVRIAGADDFQFTANTFTAQSGSSIVVPDGGLTFGSTAISSTAAELNILDGVTSTTAELNILDGVTATAAEINLIDGGTARGTTAIADGDGVLINDAGTMRQTTVETLKTYIGGGITQADQWRITTEFTGDATPINSNWERNDDLFGYIGDGVSESSGVFTLPATGKYFVTFQFIHQFDQTDGYTLFDIEGCSDGSSFNRISRHHMGGSGGDHRSGYCNAIFNCNNTSTHLLRFSISNSNSSNSTKGATGEQQTGATFIRLGA